MIFILLLKIISSKFQNQLLGKIFFDYCLKLELETTPLNPTSISQLFLLQSQRPVPLSQLSVIIIEIVFTIRTDRLIDMYNFITIVSSHIFELFPVVLAAILSVFILKSQHKPISFITRIANALFILTLSFVFLMIELDVNMRIYWIALAATGVFMIVRQVISRRNGEFKEPVPTGYIFLEDEYSSPSPFWIKLLFGVVWVLAALHINYLSMVIGTVLLCLFTIISFFFVTKKPTFYVNLIFSLLCVFPTDVLFLSLIITYITMWQRQVAYHVMFIMLQSLQLLKQVLPAPGLD